MKRTIAIISVGLMLFACACTPTQYGGQDKQQQSTESLTSSNQMPSARAQKIIDRINATLPENPQLTREEVHILLEEGGLEGAEALGRVFELFEDS